MTFREDYDDTVDEIDVDTCLGCGRAYGATAHVEDLWRKSFNYRPDVAMPQLCHRCMRGDPSPQEY